MKNLNAIKKIVTDGHFSEAHTALEDLLEMGPKNVEAIKLKAALFAHVGRFEEEEAAWRRVIEIDNEDEDAIEYYQGAQLEDREHYYFTDVLPHGGRRYLAYPKALMTVSFAGLVGCGLFLMLSRAGSGVLSESPILLFATFLATVISPWLAIFYMFVKSIRAIELTRDGFEVKTRVTTRVYPWREIDQLVLAHSDDLETGKLSLVLKPKDPSLRSISIDLTPHSSAVRARRHLLAEVRDHFPALQHQPSSLIVVDPKNHVRY